MSWDWADFLKLAEGLYRDPEQPGPEEACYRTAISRAYYAAHHSARELATRKDGIKLPDSGAAHGDLIRHFQSSPHRPRRRIGNRLDRLRSYRTSADYRKALHGNPERVAASSVKMATKLLDDVRILMGRRQP